MESITQLRTSDGGAPRLARSRRKQLQADEDEEFAASLLCLVGDEDLQAIHADFDGLQKKAMVRIED